MKIAWFLKMLGALIILQGVATIFVGYFAGDFRIIITGILIGPVLGAYLIMCGRNRERETVKARNGR